MIRTPQPEAGWQLEEMHTRDSVESCQPADLSLPTNQPECVTLKLYLSIFRSTHEFDRMSWWKRKPRDVIPNPRDKRKRDDLEQAQRNFLVSTQFLVFALALLLLAEVSLR